MNSNEGELIYDEETLKKAKSPMVSHLYRFGSFEMNPEKQILLRNNIKLILTRKQFTVLRLLVENAPRVVSKESLLSAGWPDDEDAGDDHLAHLMKALRDRLGQNPPVIGNVARQGYYLLMSVTKVSMEPISENAHRRRSPKVRIAPRRRR